MLHLVTPTPTKHNTNLLNNNYLTISREILLNIQFKAHIKIRKNGMVGHGDLKMDTTVQEACHFLLSLHHCHGKSINQPIMKASSSLIPFSLPEPSETDDPMILHDFTLQAQSWFGRNFFL